MGKKASRKAAAAAAAAAASQNQPSPPAYSIDARSHQALQAESVGGNAALLQTYAPPAFQTKDGSLERYDTMTSYVGSSTQLFVAPVAMLDKPTPVCCPYCRSVGMTKIKHTSGAITWFTCFGISLIGCVFGCCLVPFCCNKLRDVKHHCPSCEALLAIHKRL